MSDDFLIRSAPQVPAGLEDRIGARLAEPTTLPPRRPWGIRGALQWSRSHRVLAIAIGVALLGACSTGLLRLAGFVFEQRAEPPAPPPAGAHPVAQQAVSRTEALAAIGFKVRIPTWSPEGYGLSDAAMVTLPEEQSPVSEAWQVWLFWEKDAWHQVLLLAFPSEYYRGDALPFGPASVEEITVNGEPAAAVRGNWAPVAGGRWEETLGGNVLWARDGTMYWLQSAWVSLEDLVRMADSQP